MGSGTTLIEAKLLNRHAVGVDINPQSVSIVQENLQFRCDTNSKIFVKNGNAMDLHFIKDSRIDFICTHPPYSNIIEYSKEIEGDISLLDVDDFLIEMKKVYCFNRFVLFVMVLSLATTFTSCSNDDDEDIPVYSLKDVEGNYLGKMTTESAPVIPTENAGESEEPVGIEVNAEVKDNEIAINNFPVDDLIKSIIEDPDQAEIIIKAIGDINYKIPYTATFNENKDNILLQLQPEPLEIKFDPSTQLTANEKEPTEITVIVTVQADEKGDFAYNGKTLKFAIKATKVEVGNTTLDKFPITTFNFDMSKK